MKMILRNLFLSALLCCVCKAELVGYYKCDGNFLDSSGRNNNLTALEENPQFIVDDLMTKTGNIVYSPVDASGSGASGIIPNMDVRKGMTICGFYRHVSNDNYCHIFGFGNRQSPKNAYFFGLSWGKPYIQTGDAKHKIILPRLKNLVWHHIALVVPPEIPGKPQAFRLFLNGKEQFQEKNSPRPWIIQYGTCPNTFTIGQYSGKQNRGKAFDDIRIYNEALSSEKIEKLCAGYNFEAGIVVSYGAFVRKRILPTKKLAIRNTLKLKLGDANNILVMANDRDFLIRRLQAEYGDFFRKLEDSHSEVPEWSRSFQYRFAMAELIEDYRGKIVDAYADAKKWTVLVNGTKAPLPQCGYWMNAIACLRVPDSTGASDVKVEAAEVVHCSYLELQNALKNGDDCQIITPLGEVLNFVYKKEERSCAIKVNQVGFSTEANEKYAYIGLWRGPEILPRNYDAWIGKKCFIQDTITNKIVGTAEISARPQEKRFESKTRPDGLSPSGEKVYQIDLSKFKTRGSYQLFVPGIGSSWPFVIGPDAVGRAFYVRMRGMYHKRCGIAKEPPYTQWKCGACHQKTYVGNFPPNNYDYNDKGKTTSGFYLPNGKRVKVSHFDVIQRNCTTRVLVPGGYGGWHDAADYDRRPYHFEAVGDFIGAWMLFPENFLDGQLDIPESGNGIPDILDEAEWGLAVWRRCQNKSGGVGCWIEGRGHPGIKSHNPALDNEPYFLAFPTRESTAQYSAYAASFANAMHLLGKEEKATLYCQSAELGYAFAMDPAKTASVPGLKARVTLPGNKREIATLTYKEEDKIPGLYICKAAYNLYILTQKQKYLDDFEKYADQYVGYWIKNLFWNSSPFFFPEILTYEGKRLTLLKMQGMLREQMIHLGDTRCREVEENYDYRMPWYAPTHKYSTHCAWGSMHPLRRARDLVVAYYVTGDAKYRDAAFLANDWMLGENPQGISMTSGLGKVYPIRFLDLPSETDGIDEFIPGITPYMYAYHVHYNAVNLAYGIFLKAREDHSFYGKKVCLLKDVLHIPDKKPSWDTYSKYLSGAIPVFRRFSNLENYTVRISEYTVNETIAASAAVTGCLLSKGWKPPPEWKNKKPSDNVHSLPGAWILP